MKVFVHGSFLLCRPKEGGFSRPRGAGKCRLRAAGAKGVFSFQREYRFFRTGAKEDAAQVPRDATPIFFPEKENGRRPSKRKAFRLAVSGLNGLCASGMEMPARGGAASALQDDLPLLLLSAVAQPLAALLPYGCGTPLAGAALLIL